MTKNTVLTPQPDVARSLGWELKLLDETAEAIPDDAGTREMTELGKRLSLWSEVATSIDLNDLRADRNTPDASRYGCTASSLVAADNGNRALSYLKAVTGPNVHGQKLASVTDLDTLQGLHTILHSGGLDKVQGPSGRTQITPGEWRTTPDGVPDARTGKLHPSPDPKDLPAVMQAWAKDFSAANWADHHPAVHAAQAHASLVAIRPFADGNGRVARMVAGGILNEAGYPAPALTAMNERYRAPINARLFDAIAQNDAVGWTRAFAGLATEGMDAIGQQVPRLRQDVIRLASTMGQNAGVSHKDRHALAVSMMTYPIDRPMTFAQRNGLDRDQTQELLRPLVRKGLVEMGRINGKQVMITHPGLEAARTLASPQTNRLQQITRKGLRVKSPDTSKEKNDEQR